MIRWTFLIVGVLIGLLVLTAAGFVGYGVWTVARTVPEAEGTVPLGDRLSAPVTVTRDAFGIPVIRAETLRDATVALGYVHAQDRLWQMESMRRLGAGRLSEIFGFPTVDIDRFMRTLGLNHLVEAQWEALDPRTRDAARAYADGVNAFIADPPGGLPWEFRIIVHDPEPWAPQDSMYWQRFMALQLSGNWHEELLNTRLLNRLDAEAVAFLVRTEPDDPAPLTTAGATGQGLPDALLRDLAEATPAAVRPTLASNAWALAPAHTASGGAMLASDPHLGFQIPIRWYLVRIETPELTLEGATFPGVPFLVIGHNEHLAWGFTTTHSDTVDLYRETPGADPDTYERPDGPVPFETRTETIGVRFGGDRTLTVRETVHGPVVSDLSQGRFRAALGPGGEDADGDVLVSMAAAGLHPEDTTPDALYRLNRARDLDAALAALDRWDAPQQNIMLADAGGRVAMAVPGRVPLRAPGHDGRVIAEGSTGAMDWRGWQPRDSLPVLLDPPSGRVLNANNRVHPEDRPHPLAVSFPEPYRAQRLAARLGGMTGATMEDMAALQMDAVSGMAADLVPALVFAARAGAPTHPDAGAVLDRLEGWDPPEMAADRPEPLVLAAWIGMVTERLFRDELGAAFDAWADRPRPLPIRLALTEAVGWCDDVDTAAPESCPAQVAAALDEALAWIEEETDAAPLQARWGEFHQVRIRHDMLGMLPGLGRMIGLTAPTDGGDFTLNRGGHAGLDGRPPFAHGHGAGLRAVMDLAPPARGRFVIATGQSGNPMSPHYDDQFPAWRDGTLLPIGLGPDRGTMTLTP
ncbi:penicillin acylase family protein [Roseospira navarrensis]|uniref:Penicillin acylase family protein n=1 Tax=Roseospira navarrensis TaxID=140058 RepID=A0A7X2D1Z3_9PROT|nr:penicillin acylase family protein [Roseospira navarrensis]MQX35724.1 penicillin acylase family protein [Roseospira navarrensis]